MKFDFEDSSLYSVKVHSSEEQEEEESECKKVNPSHVNRFRKK